MTDLAKHYTTKIISSKEVAKHTYAVMVEKPQDFQPIAGQYVSLALIHAPHQDPKGNYRWFSLASAPHEPYVMFIFRKSDSVFKEELLKLSPGAEVEISTPRGDFILPPSTDKPVVFLAGGVGVTPIRSMVVDSLQKKTGHHIQLLYSNFTPEETVFFKEFSEMNDPNFSVVFTMTGTQHSYSSWSGETRLIDDVFIRDHVQNVEGSLFYIVGPPGFLHAMLEVMRKLSVPREQIKMESFGGY